MEAKMNFSDPQRLIIRKSWDELQEENYDNSETRE